MERLGSSHRADSGGYAHIRTAWCGRSFLFGAPALWLMCGQRGKPRGHVDRAVLRHLTVSVCGALPRGLAELYQGCHGFLVQVEQIQPTAAEAEAMEAPDPSIVSTFWMEAWPIPSKIGH